MTTRYTVYEAPEVFWDYVAIAEHVERWTGDRAMADRTVDAIRGFIRGLAVSPHRGRQRDDLRSGLRVAPFKRRTAVAFEVDEAALRVTVLRVFFGGQDYEAILRR